MTRIEFIDRIVALGFTMICEDSWEFNSSTLKLKAYFITDNKVEIRFLEKEKMPNGSIHTREVARFSSGLRHVTENTINALKGSIALQR